MVARYIHSGRTPRFGQLSNECRSVKLLLLVPYFSTLGVFLLCEIYANCIPKLGHFTSHNHKATHLLGGTLAVYAPSVALSALPLEPICEFLMNLVKLAQQHIHNNTYIL